MTAPGPAGAMSLQSAAATATRTGEEGEKRGTSVSPMSSASSSEGSGEEGGGVAPENVKEIKAKN